MLSKNKIKLIQALDRKKKRDETGLFVAEGEKLISQLALADFEIDALFYTDKAKSIENINAKETDEVSFDEIKKISQLKTPGHVIAICKKKESDFEACDFRTNIVLALDNIQDPGNLGTIIRLASWFGIDDIVCSSNCVDCYNPKVIQATMGAIAHVNIHYTDLSQFLKQALNSNNPVYGTFLEGENIYDSALSNNGIVVFGNEGSGICAELELLITNKLLIPPFKKGEFVESLNVSMAAAIVCSEFRRKFI